MDFEGVQVKDVYPREVKDIFAGNQILLIGKYKNAGHATLKLTGQVNAEKKSFSFPLVFPAEESATSYLPRLWAMRRIGHLTDIAQDNGENREVIDEIVALSKKYGIISAYTSFLVTDPSENHRLQNAPMAAMIAPSPAGGRRSVSVRPQADALWSAASMPLRDNRAVAQAFYGGGGAGTAVAVRGTLATLASPPSGRLAVKAAKSMQSYKQFEAMADEKATEEAGIKCVEDKTFYLREGFWTDSSYEAGKSAKPELISFGSSKYFELVRQNPGLAKYLAVGKQLIVLFKGHCYKIVADGTSTT